MTQNNGQANVNSDISRETQNSASEEKEGSSPTFMESDVKNWLKNCATESDGVSVSKQALWDSFAAFMDIKIEVGKDLFFAYLGNSLIKVGYTKVNPEFKRHRRVGYVGLKLAMEKTANPTFDVKKTKSTKTNIHVPELLQWMETNYCEGGQDDVISKQDLWLHYSSCCGIADDERPVFFSLLGNSVLKQPAFRQVKRCSSKDDANRVKNSAFKFLKKTHQSSKNGKVLDSGTFCKEGQSQISTENDDSLSCAGKSQEILGNMSESSKDIHDGTRDKTKPASYDQENPHLNSLSDFEDGCEEDQSLVPTDINTSYSVDLESDTL